MLPSQSMKASFPKWYALSDIADNRLWAMPVDWLSASFIRGLSFALEADLGEKGTALGERCDLCCAIIGDICSLQETAESADVKLSMDLVRLIVSTEAMKACAAGYRLSLLYHWISTSLSDDEFPRELDRRSDMRREDLLRVWLFFKLPVNPAVLENSYLAVIEWASVLYYYERRGGEHRALAEDAFDTLLKIAATYLTREPVFSARPTAHFLLQVGPWAEAHRPKSVPEIMELLEGVVINESIPRTVRMEAGLGLAIAFLSNLDQRKHWASKTRKEFDDIMTPTDRLELLLANLDEDLESAIQDAMTAIEDHVSLVRSALAENKIEFRYTQTRYFQKLGPLLARCASKGSSQSILRVLACWFGVPMGKRRISPVLCCFPTPVKGPQYAFQGTQVAFEHADSRMFSEVILSMNKWLGKNTIVVDDPSFLQEMEDRIAGEDSNEPSDGTPESLLVEFYKLREMKVHLPEIRSATGLLITHFLQHPLQTMMLKELHTTWPIVTSYEEPLPDRVLRKAFLWTVGTETGKREIETIGRDLEERGVDVDLHLEEDIDEGLFRQIYECADYDVIWIAAHGIFDPYRPELAGILLSADGQNKVLLEEILHMSLSLNQRRLLVLNMCSGADGLVGEGPTGVGIASMLATREQATISHLWPVYESSAIAFGLLLSEGLLQTKEHFAAFAHAAQGLEGGPKCFQERLRIGTAAARRVAKHIDSTYDEQEWRSLYRWGSPVFYE